MTMTTTREKEGKREGGKEREKKEHIIWLILSQRYFKANYAE